MRTNLKTHEYNANVSLILKKMNKTINKCFVNFRGTSCILVF